MNRLKKYLIIFFVCVPSVVFAGNISVLKHDVQMTKGAFVLNFEWRSDFQIETVSGNITGVTFSENLIDENSRDRKGYSGRYIKTFTNNGNIPSDIKYSFQLLDVTGKRSQNIEGGVSVEGSSRQSYIDDLNNGVNVSERLKSAQSDLKAADLAPLMNELKIFKGKNKPIVVEARAVNYNGIDSVIFSFYDQSGEEVLKKSIDTQGQQKIKTQYVPAALSDGSYVVTVVAVSSTGKQSNSKSQHFYIDEKISSKINAESKTVVSEPVAVAAIKVVEPKVKVSKPTVAVAAIKVVKPKVKASKPVAVAPIKVVKPQVKASKPVAVAPIKVVKPQVKASKPVAVAPIIVVKPKVKVSKPVAAAVIKVVEPKVKASKPVAVTAIKVVKPKAKVSKPTVAVPVIEEKSVVIIPKQEIKDIEAPKLSIRTFPLNIKAGTSFEVRVSVSDNIALKELKIYLSNGIRVIKSTIPANKKNIIQLSGYKQTEINFILISDTAHKKTIDFRLSDESNNITKEVIEVSVKPTIKPKFLSNPVFHYSKEWHKGCIQLKEKQGVGSFSLDYSDPQGAVSQVYLRSTFEMQKRQSAFVPGGNPIYAWGNDKKVAWGNTLHRATEKHTLKFFKGQIYQISGKQKIEIILKSPYFPDVVKGLCIIGSQPSLEKKHKITPPKKHNTKPALPPKQKQDSSDSFEELLKSLVGD